MLLLEARDALPAEDTPEVFVIAMGDDALRHAMAQVDALRTAHPGLGIVQQLGGGSFRSQMKKADRSGASLALLWGEDEVSAREVTVKPLRGNGEQIRVAETELGHQLSKLLNDNS